MSADAERGSAPIPDADHGWWWENLHCDNLGCTRTLRHIIEAPMVIVHHFDGDDRLLGVLPIDLYTVRPLNELHIRYEIARWGVSLHGGPIYWPSWEQDRTAAALPIDGTTSNDDDPRW